MKTNRCSLVCLICIWFFLVITGTSQTVTTITGLTTLEGVTVLNFDDLGGGQIPVNYGGLIWNESWWTNSGIQPPYTASSPPVTATSYDNMNGVSWTGLSYIDFPAPTVFNGAYFAGYFTVRYDLYSNGTLVLSTPDVAIGETPIFIPSQFSGAIDRVQIQGGQGYFVMDDFSFGVIPEPSTYMLLGLGVAIVGLWQRKRLRR